MPLKLLPKLPSKETNGLGILLAETIADDGTVKPGAETTRLAVVKLVLDEHGVKAGDPKAVYRIEHAETVPPGSDDETVLRNLLVDRLEERRANGQLTFDPEEPTLMAELLAEFGEVADDLGIEVTAFKAEFSEAYQHPPEMAGEHELREWIGLKRPPKGRPVETIAAAEFSGDGEPVAT